MAKIKQWMRRHLPTRRRLIQLYAALLYNANVKGFLQGEIYTGPVKNLCVPGLNCYSCPGAVGACPLGSLQNALASSGSRAPYYVLGVLMLFGLTLGRVVCGFLCPMGLLQELLHRIPTPKVRKSRYTRALSWVKYVILAVFVVILPLMYALQRYPVPAFCKYICPAGTLEGAAALLAHPENASLFAMLGALFTRKWVILVASLVACVFIFRAFCRFVCPLGAIYGLFSRVALLGVKVEQHRCTGCGACVARCPMDIRRVGDHECIQCGACMDACATGAIRWKGGKITLAGRETAAPRKRRLRRFLAWGMALAVLLGAWWYFGQPSQQAAEVPGVADVADTLPVGSQEGQRCPDFIVPCYNGEDFTLAAHRGQVVVINFWATWCTPCCAELPYFQQLADAYPKEVAVVAIHSSLVTDDVPGYLAGQPYTFPFALDETGEALAALGGSLILPQTVILDQEGVVVYNQVGSVTYDFLAQQVTQLLAR